MLTTQTQTTARKRKLNENENRDSIMLTWLDFNQKWFAPKEELVSKEYWEWVFNRKIEYGVPFYSPEFKQRTKFIRQGEAIN